MEAVIAEIVMIGLNKLSVSCSRLSEADPRAMAELLADEDNRHIWLAIVKDLRGVAYDIERLVAGQIH